MTQGASSQPEMVEGRVVVVRDELKALQAFVEGMGCGPDVTVEQMFEDGARMAMASLKVRVQRGTITVSELIKMAALIQEGQKQMNVGVAVQVQLVGPEPR